MIEAVLVALVVAAGGVFGQWLLRRQDFRRQDEVAARVAEAADRLAADTSQVSTKLDEIHALVNSNMTAAVRGEMVAVEAQLFLTRRLAQIEPGPDDVAVLTTLAGRVAELQAVLADRSMQQVAADTAARPL